MSDFYEILDILVAMGEYIDGLILGAQIYVVVSSIILIILLANSFAIKEATRNNEKRIKEIREKLENEITKNKDSIEGEKGGKGNDECS